MPEEAGEGEKLRVVLAAALRGGVNIEHPASSGAVRASVTLAAYGRGVFQKGASGVKISEKSSVVGG
jgi:hypothetical protein